MELDSDSRKLMELSKELHALNSKCVDENGAPIPNALTEEETKHARQLSMQINKLTQKVMDSLLDSI